jgi:hypothetical protein
VSTLVRATDETISVPSAHETELQVTSSSTGTEIPVRTREAPPQGTTRAVTTRRTTTPVTGPRGQPRTPEAETNELAPRDETVRSSRAVRRGRWRQTARWLHRDLGYFFTGVVLVYSVSGLAMNHAEHWDPDFVVERREVALPLPSDAAQVDDAAVDAALGGLGEHGALRTYDFPTSGRIKIFLEDGTIASELGSGLGTYESLRRRPVLYGMNRLHLEPKGWWLAFSDVFAVALLLIALTGLVLARGRHGLEGRGKWLVGAGAALPLLGLLLA